MINNEEDKIFENEEEYSIIKDILTTYIINEESTILIETDINQDQNEIFNYSFKAEYYSNKANSLIQLINNSYLDYIIEMRIDNVKINPCYEYNFSYAGNHIVYFLMDNNLDSFAYIFYDIFKLKSINFTDNSDLKNIKNMEYMLFFCDSLKNIDFSNLNTENVLNMEAMFFHVYYIETLNLSSFNTQNVINMKNMFNNCGFLKSADVSNFNTRNVIYME